MSAGGRTMMIEVQVHATKGRVLLAKTPLYPGTVGLQVLEEEALIMVPPLPEEESERHSSQRTDLEDLQRELTKTLAYYENFKKQSITVQRKIMDFYKQMDCPKASSIRRLLSAKGLSGADADEFVEVAMVFEFNAVACRLQQADGNGPGPLIGTGLFQLGCMMSHSCLPNTIWFTSPDGKSKILRVIKPVEIGEELTVAYYEDLTIPTAIRRAKLQRSKAFVCDCERCGRPADDTRRFPCDDPQCNGVVFVSQPLSSAAPEFLSCTVCATNTVHASAHLRREVC